MLESIIRLALGNRTVVLVCAAVLIVAGLHTASRMEVDVFPDLNAPTVTVMTEAEGMAAEEVEKLVTFPVETAVNGAAGVRRVRSSSAAGFSIVWVEFDWGTDIYKARQTVSEKLSLLSGSLPSNAGAPMLGPQTSILGELMIIGMTADSTSMEDLRTLAERNVRPRLLATGGVAQVSVIGGDIKEYRILLDPGAMKHYGISLDEAVSAAENLNQNISGGTIYEYGNEYVVRGMLSVNEAAEMEKGLVKTVGGMPVTLGDIAKVETGPRMPRLGTASEKGRPAVLLTVTKQPDTGTLELTERIEASLKELEREFPADVRVSTDIFRQARFIENAIDNVEKSLYEGAFFVVIVLFLFLMNWRTTVISLVSIPVSMVVSLLIIKLMGLTVNTMTLGGLAIAVGSLVDDSIVDVENVFKRLRENRLKPPGERAGTLETVFEASKEVRMPMLNSTLIIVAGLLPLFFLSGMEGRMLKPLGIAFVTSLFASTAVALTLTPVLASLLLGGKEGKDREPALVLKLKDIYGYMLEKAIRHRVPLLVCTAAVFAVALVMFFSMGRSFLPPFNEGSYTISVSSMPGISLEESDAIGRQAEMILLSIPEIRTVGRKTGRAELDEHSFGVNTSELECPFVLEKRSRSELLAEIREKLSVIPGVNIEIGGPIAHRIDAMLSGTKSQIAIKLFGTDLSSMYSIGKRIKEAISEVPGITDINVEQQVERPELKIVPKREMLAACGITLPEFAGTVETLLRGRILSYVYEGNNSFAIRLRVREEDSNSMERLGNLLIDSPASGGKVPLSAVADIISSSGPNTINRENVARKIVVSCNATGGELSKTVAGIRKAIDTNISLPENCHIEYGGQFESEQRASRTIALVSIMSLLLIFMLLFGEFGSVRRTLVILLNLPLALIGGVIAIYFTEGLMSIPAVIGFITLFGIATRNGMLLIDRYDALGKEGYSTVEAVVAGSLDRLNPILMTALTSALALLPLALGGDKPGTEIQSPMAVTILGGLFSSTLLNGFIIPAVFILTDRKNSKRK